MDAMTVPDRIVTLTGDLAARGLLASDQWRRALHEVPRHLFVPERGWASPDFNAAAQRAIDRQADETDWWNAVYSDTSIRTQAGDGATDPAGNTGLATSSISAPGVVTAFLELLDVRDHDRVLDIGTGTGWTAALLSARVGEDNVTSIEVDKEVAAQAAANLKNAGYAPRLIVGEGADGWAEDAPYDRVHVTCAVSRIPHAWIEQTRPGGVLVLPWSPDRDGHRVRLTVLGDGTAAGSLHGPASYMMLRSQRPPTRWQTHHAGEADHTVTRLDPRTIHYAGPAVDLAIISRAPGITMFPIFEDNGAFSLMMHEFDRTEGSWAACDYEPAKNEFDVTQYGGRRLWDEVADAYLWWAGAGRPDYQRFGLTVTPDGQRVWLDSPCNVVSPEP